MHIALPWAGVVCGAHSHPGGVMGYVVLGEAVFAIRDPPARSFVAGDAFYEPPNVVIERCDNASDSAELMFVAFYPLIGAMPLFTPAD